MSDDAQGNSMAAITAWIDAVEQRLLDARVPARQRRFLVADLERDVRDAVADGAPPSQFLREDPADLARRLIGENDLDPAQAPQSRPTPLTTATLVATGLTGALAGGAFAWFFVYTGPVVTAFIDPFIGVGLETPTILGLHLFSAALVMLGASAAIRWRFRATMSNWSLAIRASLFMAAAGVLSIRWWWGSARPPTTAPSRVWS